MSDVLLRIDEASPTPAYRQIVDQVRWHLHTGDLSPGDRLPSMRDLAAQLGIHFNTVAEAYRQLATEGWIELRHGRGATVLPRSAGKLSSADAQGLRQRLRELLAEMRLHGVSPSDIRRDVAAALRS